MNVCGNKQDRKPQAPWAAHALLVLVASAYKSERQRACVVEKKGRNLHTAAAAAAVAAEAPSQRHGEPKHGRGIET